MVAEKPTQLPADDSTKETREAERAQNKAQREQDREQNKDQRAQDREQRKADRDRLRFDPENTTVDENTGEVLPADELSPEDAEEQAALGVDEHPHGNLAGDLQLEDLPEPKPKVDLFPDHAPRALPVKIQDVIDAAQERVEARLEQLNDEREERKQAREEAKDNAKEQAEVRQEVRRETATKRPHEKAAAAEAKVEAKHEESVNK